jgi:signal transduction histidine kinase
VTHQIKNSLHALGGYAERMGDASGEGACGARQAFLAALHGLSTLANDVLAVGGLGRPAVETLNVRDVVSSALTLMRDRSRPVSVALPAGPFPVRANREQLIHALFNLIDNACQASPPGTGVTVRAGVREECVLLEIVDGGPGPDPAIAHASGPVVSPSGTGIGLMAARRFLAASGGSLSFGRDADGRSVCSVRVPRAAAAPAAAG